MSIDIRQELQELKERLDDILPEPNEDGVFGDGSNEYYAGLFETAWDKADTIARRLIVLLEEMIHHEP